MTFRILLPLGGLKRSPGFIIVRRNEYSSGRNAGRAAFESVSGVFGRMQSFVLLFFITKVWGVTDLCIVAICEVVGDGRVGDGDMQSFSRFSC